MVGAVGIFWVMSKKGEQLRLLTDLVPVDHAEVYGDFRTHGGHYEFWKMLAGLGARELRHRDLPQEPTWAEYEDYPRGRVVFHIPSGKFTIYADRKLWKPATIASIAEKFGVQSGAYFVRGDSHYITRAER
jgi:hypothetical protein